MAKLLPSSTGLYSHMRRDNRRVRSPAGWPRRQVADYRTPPLKAAACFQNDFEVSVAHLPLLVMHHRATGTANPLIERLFVEDRRRLKMFPNAFRRKPVPKLMFGTTMREHGESSGSLTSNDPRWSLAVAISITITRHEMRPQNQSQPRIAWPSLTKRCSDDLIAVNQ
jgi:hypothetical protein